MNGWMYGDFRSIAFFFFVLVVFFFSFLYFFLRERTLLHTHSLALFITTGTLFVFGLYAVVCRIRSLC